MTSTGNPIDAYVVHHYEENNCETLPHQQQQQQIISRQSSALLDEHNSLNNNIPNANPTTTAATTTNHVTAGGGGASNRSGVQQSNNSLSGGTTRGLTTNARPTSPQQPHRRTGWGRHKQQHDSGNNNTTATNNRQQLQRDPSFGEGSDPRSSNSATRNLITSLQQQQQQNNNNNINRHSTSALSRLRESSISGGNEEQLAPAIDDDLTLRADGIDNENRQLRPNSPLHQQQQPQMQNDQPHRRSSTTSKKSKETPQSLVSITETDDEEEDEDDEDETTGSQGTTENNNTRAVYELGPEGIPVLKKKKNNKQSGKKKKNKTGKKHKKLENGIQQDELMNKFQPGEIVVPPPHFDGIRPYVPSKRVKWLSVSLENSLVKGFKDDAVHSEFLRFLHRDITALLICIPYAGGLLYAILNILSFDGFLLHPYITSIFTALMGQADAFIHFCVPNPTSFWIQARRAIVILCTISFLLECSFTLFGTQINCPKQFNYLKEWGIQPSRENAALGSPKYRRECIEIVHAYAMVTVCVGVPFMKLQFPVTIALLILTYVLWMLGFVFYDDGKTYLTSTQIGALLLVSLTALLYSFGFTYFKATLQQEQFLAAIDVTKKHKQATAAAEQVDKLLCSMLPPSVLSRVLVGEPVEDSTPSGTVFASDQANFTLWSSTRSAQEVVDLLNQLCIAADTLCHKTGIEKICTIGDAYIAVSGMPNRVPDHAARVVQFAILYQEMVERITKKKADWNDVRYRAGVHSGPIQATIFGTSQLRYEIFGETSQIAEQIEKHGVAGRVLVSEATADLLFGNVSIKCYPLLKQQYLSSNNNSNNTPSSEKQNNNNNPSITTTVMINPQTNQEQEQICLLLSGFLSPAMRQHLPPSLPLFIAKFDDDGVSLHSSVESVALPSTTSEGDTEKEMRKKFIKEKTRQRRKIEQQRKKREHQQMLMNNNNSSFGSMDSYSSYSPSSSVMAMGGASSPTSPNNLSSIEEFEAHFSERKYNWIFYDFLHSESEYLEFAQQKMRSTVLWCRCLSTLMIVAIFLSVLIQGEAFSANALALLLSALILSILCIIVTIFYAIPQLETEEKKEQNIDEEQQQQQQEAEKKTTTRSTQLYETIAACLLLATVPLACSGTAVIPNSMAGNDAIWLPMFYGSIVAGGITNISAFLRFVVFLATVDIPLCAIQWDNAMMQPNLVFLVLATLLTFLCVAFFEKLLRRQFIEHVVAREYSKKMLESADEQKTLLESMVPKHVIDDLMVWMKNDLATDKSIGKEEFIVVGFVELVRRKEEDQQQNQFGLNDDHQQQQQQNNNNNVTDHNQNRSGGYTPTTGSMMAFAEQHQHQLLEKALDLQEDEASWLSLSHLEVDRIINELTELHMMKRMKMLKRKRTTQKDGSSIVIPEKFSIIKIKVMGNTIMFGGPFEKSSSNEVNGNNKDRNSILLKSACVDMLELFNKLTTESTLFTAKCGAHVGQVLAAVLGTERLQFDLFGDVVNSASRVSTLKGSQQQQAVDENNADAALNNVGENGRVFVSNDLYTLIEDQQKNFYEFGPIQQIQAKGKGFIDVRSVSFVGGSHGDDDAEDDASGGANAAE